MDILKLLLDQVENQDALKQLSKTVGAKPDQVKKLAEEGLPTLLAAMSKNASSEKGAASLNKALTQHQDDNADDVLGFLKGVDLKEGGKILNHILGDKTANVENKLAASSGLNKSQVDTLLTQFAPLLLAQLGKQKKQGNINEGNLVAGIGSLLGKNGSKDIMGLATKFLDADGDGDIMDDLGKKLGGFFKK